MGIVDTDKACDESESDAATVLVLALCCVGPLTDAGIMLSFFRLLATLLRFLLVFGCLLSLCFCRDRSGLIFKHNIEIVPIAGAFLLAFQAISACWPSFVALLYVSAYYAE